MNRRVVLFARVSTEERGQDAQSQLLALRSVAARFAWQVVAEVPLEISAWTEKTAAHVRRQALAAVRLHRADVLAVWALDRVCRAGIIEAFSRQPEGQFVGGTIYTEHLGLGPLASTDSADGSTRTWTWTRGANVAYIAKFEGLVALPVSSVLVGALSPPTLLGLSTLKRTF